MVSLRSRGAGFAISITRPLRDAGPDLSGDQLDGKGQLLVPRVGLTKFVLSNSHSKLPKKESVTPVCQSGAGRVKKCPSAAWQTLRAESARLGAQNPPAVPSCPTAPPHAPSSLFSAGQQLQQVGKDPLPPASRWRLSPAGPDALRNFAIITHSFFF